MGTLNLSQLKVLHISNIIIIVLFQKMLAYFSRIHVGIVCFGDLTLQCSENSNRAQFTLSFKNLLILRLSSPLQFLWGGERGGLGECRHSNTIHVVAQWLHVCISHLYHCLSPSVSPLSHYPWADPQANAL